MFTNKNKLITLGTHRGLNESVNKKVRLIFVISKTKFYFYL